MTKVPKIHQTTTITTPHAIILHQCLPPISNQYLVQYCCRKGVAFALARAVTFRIPHFVVIFDD